MDTAQWPQELLMKPSMEEMIPNTTCSNIISNNNNNDNNHNNNNSVMNMNNNNKNNNSKGATAATTSSTSLERKVRPQKDEAVNCPRCNSTNTKFCYYNNYSLTQPRYFCKTCRRYWTEGGSLRNIPVGGGSRKNKRSSSSSTSPSSKKLSTHHHHDHHHLLASSTQPPHHHHHHHHQNPNKFYHHHQGQDLNLGFPPNHQQEFRSLSEFMQLPTIESTTPTKSHQILDSDPNNTTTTTTSNVEQQNNHHHHHLSALELLNGLTSSRGLTPFMPMPVPDPNGIYSSGFQMHDFKPSLNFSLVDGLGNGYGGLQGDEACETTTTTTNNNNSNNSSNNNNNGRLLFPFEDLKQVSSNTSADHHNSADNHHHHHHDLNGEQGDSTPGYWSGMLGNEGSW